MIFREASIGSIDIHVFICLGSVKQIIPKQSFSLLNSMFGLKSKQFFSVHRLSKLFCFAVYIVLPYISGKKKRVNIILHVSGLNTVLCSAVLVVQR